MNRGSTSRVVVSVTASVLVTFGSAGPCAADDAAQNQALATTLFHEARSLIDAGEIAKACPKLAESQRLQPAGGTLLNLAVCHEKEGKTATAWAEFREARVVAERDRRDDRIELADEHLKALQPRLSKLVIEVSADVDIAGLEVTVEGRLVGRPAWGSAMPVDPGDHVIEARAPGKKAWRTDVALAEAASSTVVLPAWESEAPPPATSSEAPVLPVPSDARAARSATSGSRRTFAIVAGAIGVGGVAVGSYFGLRALAKHDEGRDACTSRPCSTTIDELNDSAKTAADTSTIAFSVGIVALGIGTYLWLTASSSTATTRSVQLRPSSGSVLSGVF